MPPDPSPPADGSITQWIDGLRGGDPEAAGRLCERYFRDLLALAKRRLNGAATPTTDDEEDIALSAFQSFCTWAGAGKFPLLQDRDDLWPLLATLTLNKSLDAIKRERRQKRGGDAGRADPAALFTVAARGPGPDSVAEMAEECRKLLDRLGDPVLRSVALLRLEGYTADEIGDRLGCTSRTVERKLLLIRRLWSEGDAA